MRSRFKIAAMSGVLFLTALAAPADASVFVSANPPTPTLIGAVTAGQTYTVTASGLASLCGNCNNGGPLSFTADGKPSPAALGAYAAFNPNGLDHDPTGSSFPGTGGFGQGGAGVNLGSLLGTFNGAPTGPASFFSIGLGTSFTAATNGFLYAVVNDTYYADNPTESGFNVDFGVRSQEGAVPEPATWAMMLMGFAGIGGAMRRRRKIPLAQMA